MRVADAGYGAQLAPCALMQVVIAPCCCLALADHLQTTLALASGMGAGNFTSQSLAASYTTVLNELMASQAW